MSGGIGVLRDTARATTAHLVDLRHRDGAAGAAWGSRSTAPATARTTLQYRRGRHFAYCAALRRRRQPRRPQHGRHRSEQRPSAPATTSRSASCSALGRGDDLHLTPTSPRREQHPTARASSPMRGAPTTSPPRALPLSNAASGRSPTCGTSHDARRGVFLDGDGPTATGTCPRDGGNDHVDTQRTPPEAPGERSFRGRRDAPARSTAVSMKTGLSARLLDERLVPAADRVTPTERVGDAGETPRARKSAGSLASSGAAGRACAERRLLPERACGGTSTTADSASTGCLRTSPVLRLEASFVRNSRTGRQPVQTRRSDRRALRSWRE